MNYNRSKLVGVLVANATPYGWGPDELVDIRAYTRALSRGASGLYPDTDLAVFADNETGDTWSMTIHELYVIEREATCIELSLTAMVSSSFGEVAGVCTLESGSSIKQYHWRSRWLFSLMLFTRPCLQILKTISGVIPTIAKLRTLLTRLKTRF